MEIKDILGNGDDPQKKLHTGQLLIASPLMHDMPFRKGVGILLDYNDEKGGIGLMLNKELEFKMKDAFSGLGPWGDMPIFAGGPVEPSRIFMLHTLGDAISNSLEICPGLWISSSFGEAFQYLDDGNPYEGHIRFILGYSGWSKGQLGQEVRDGAWALEEPGPDPSRLLTGSEDAFWRRELTIAGDSRKGWLCIPEHPSLN